ncbi:MAG: HAD hydrolase-like protein [Deltaproteobacteria bacterium]|nr:HAD hydrolase-like protein [Deltaproteobacteria bacterium]
MAKRKRKKSTGKQVPQYSPNSQTGNIATSNSSVDLTLWEQDSTLAEIGQLLQTTSDAVLSLDFFDTLVCRLCNAPTDLFIATGTKLESKKLLQPGFTDQQFKELRRAAEMRARQRRFWSHNTTEVTISHIYEQLYPHVVSNINDAIVCELETESSYCFINPYVESLMHFAHKNGCRICILSDMYLSSAQLEQIAVKNGLDWSKIALTATSCEHGNGKTSGFLFNYAIGQLGINPNQLLHIGDSIEADVTGATKSGVRGYHYYRTNDNSNHIYAVEKQFNNVGAAVGINAVRTLAERHRSAQTNAFVHAGCFTLGPLLAHYADWCVKEFQKRGIKKVLAFMREGRLLRKLILNSAKTMNVELEVVEFFVSRQSVHLASVGEATKENITERIYARTVAEMFDSFGIDQKVTGFPEHIANQEVKSVEMLSTLVTYLTTGRIKSMVEQRSADARRLFVKYFKSIVSENHIALVDVGWGGSMQRNIVRILQLADVNVICDGFYLANTIAACQVALGGTRLNAFLSSYNEHSHFVNTLVRSPEMIEQAVSAPIGSTIGYNEEGDSVTPILNDCVVDDREQQNRLDVQKGILLYQDFWLRILLRKSESGNQDSITQSFHNAPESVSGLCRAIAHRFIAYPTKAEALSMGSFHHDDGFHSTSVNSIASPAKVSILENDGYKKMAESPKTFWPQGVLAIADDTLVKQMACGTDYESMSEKIGMVTVSETLYARHAPLGLADIADIKINAGDWVYYEVEICCPECQKKFSVRLVGTFIICRAVSCSSCGQTFVLDFNGINVYFISNCASLSDARIEATAAKLNRFRDSINISLSTPNDVPMLASLANTICVNSLSGVISAELENDKGNA